MTTTEKHRISHSLHTHYLLPLIIGAVLFLRPVAKYKILASWLPNCTNVSLVNYAATEICVWVSINNSGSSFTTSWKMGTALLPRCILQCPECLTSPSNVLLQSGSRPNYSRKHLMFSSCLVLFKKLLPLLGVAGYSGFGVPFCR